MRVEKEKKLHCGHSRYILFSSWSCSRELSGKGRVQRDRERGSALVPLLKDWRVTVTQLNANHRKSTAFVEYVRAPSVASVTSDSATPWTPLSMGFSRQGYWSGLLCPPPGNLPDPDTEPRSTTLQADSLLLSHMGTPC